MSEAPLSQWDPATARRFMGGFGLGSISYLVIALGAVIGFSRPLLLALLAPLSAGMAIGYRAYKAAGEPTGRIFAVGHVAADAAGLPGLLWDVLVVAQLIAAILTVVAVVI